MKNINNRLKASTWLTIAATGALGTLLLINLLPDRSAESTSTADDPESNKEQQSRLPSTTSPGSSNENSNRPAHTGDVGIGGYTPTIVGKDISGYVRILGKGVAYKAVETSGSVSGSPDPKLVSEDRFRTSFVVEGYYPIGSHEFYVWGKTEKGHPLVEQWSLAPASEGYWRTYRVKHESSDRGTTVPLEPNVEELVGGEFVPTSKRWKTMEDTRKVVYEGEEPGEISAFVPDAEGRYLVFMLSGDSNVYQLWLHTAELTIIASSSSQPILTKPILASTSWNNSSWGRCIQISLVPTEFTQQETSSLLLCDLDNDGNFDHIEALSPDGEEAHGATMSLPPEDMR